MERKKIVAKQPRSMQDSFMPRPDYCERGNSSIFDGVVSIDIIICEFYCDRDCPAYREFTLKGQARKAGLKRR